MKLLFIIITLFISYNGYAANIIIPSNLNESLGEKFEIIKNSDLNIDEVLFSKEWEPIDVLIPNFGYMKESFWIRSRILNTTSNNHYIFSLENPLLDYIDIYIIQDKKIKEIYLSGDLRKLSLREVQHHYTLIPMNIKKDKFIDIYIKIQSKGSIQLPIFIKTNIQSSIDLSTSSFLHGIFGGLMLIMVLYNLFLFLAFKERSYLFFVLFASFTLLFQYTEYGFATQYSWSETPIINSFLIPILIPLVLLFMSLFLGTILGVKKSDTFSFNFLVLLFSVNFLILIGTLLFDYNIMCKIATYSAVITNFCHLIIAIIYAHKGDISVRIIAVSLFSFVLGLILFSFEKLGIIESNFITENSLKIGQSLEILFVSIALSFKINKLVHQVSHDKLTGVPNRLGFDMEMKEKFEKSQYSKTPINLLMLDVDKFKNINDRYGHTVGDQVLIHMSSIVNNVMTKCDGTVFRYGGEEFSVILYGKTPSNSVIIAEDIRSEIEKKPFYSNSVKIPLTISIGCGHFDGNDKSVHYEDLIKHADKLLYEAKHAGRNLVVSGHFE